MLNWVFQPMTTNQNKKVLTAVIVDDERLARKELISMLDDIEQIRVIGEADNHHSAVRKIKELTPEIVFLDIQMPGKSGFDVLSDIDYNGNVVFVTAYDEYAIRAFEVNALDYLLKPVSPQRLEKTIQRLLEDLETDLVYTRKLRYDDRLFLHFGTKLIFLKVDTIVLINAEGDYSQVFTSEGQKGLVTKTMREWEERLPDKQFCRIHRSAIINLDYIDKVEKWFNYSYRVSLKGIDESFTISRRYAKKIRDRFS